MGDMCLLNFLLTPWNYLWSSLIKFTFEIHVWCITTRDSWLPGMVAYRPIWWASFFFYKQKRAQQGISYHSMIRCLFEKATIIITFFFSFAVSIPHLLLLFFFLFCLILAPYFSSVYDQITTISPTTEVQHLHLVVAVYINVTSIVIYRLNTVVQVRLVSTCSTCSSPATSKWLQGEKDTFF